MANANQAPMPLYIDVANEIRDSIKNGEFPVGTNIGSQADLMSRYGVSRVTLRHALRVLEREGLVVTHQGKGSYVASTEVSQNLANLRSLAEIVEDQGLAHEVRIIDYTWLMPPDHISAFLGTPSESPVLRIRRQHIVNGLPFALAVIYLPAALGAGLTQRDVEKNSLYMLMEKRLGIGLGQAVQEIRAARAEGQTATLLQVSPGSPLLVAERKTYAVSGEPVEHITFFYRSDCYHFTVTLPRAASLDLVVPPFPGQKENSANERAESPGYVEASLHLSKDSPRYS
ncbi:MAG: GntR family transcriptional regulator [Bacillota bacterium]